MKNTTIAIIVAFILIAAAILLTNGKVNKNDESNETKQAISNVSIVDGKQIIEIQAKGGYLPRRSLAKSGIPTILRFNTKGTFDCSSSIRIPSMNVFKNLPQSGITDIDLGIQKTGTIQGSCGMGMYPFEIEFQ